MDNVVFLGRQPILDREQRVFGYELLYRASQLADGYSHSDGNHATRTVMNASLNVLSLTHVVGERRAFINITRELLLDQTWAVMPKDRTVIELLENVEPDDQVIHACAQLKKAGYMLALDDYVDRPEYAPLLPMADILKIDFLTTDADQRLSYALRFRAGGRILLAERVETRADFEDGLRLGYGLFQGYFFCKPEILSGREAPAVKQVSIRFIREVNRSTLDYAGLEDLVKRDVSLSTKLLRYLNCAALGVRHRITSIRQGLALLGERPLRKWALLAAMTTLGSDKPPELLVTCLTRARFCELASAARNAGDQEMDAFLTGLFSCLDALMDQPIETLIAQMNAPADVADALSGADTPLGRVYRLVLAFEQGNGNLINMLARRAGLPPEKASRLYINAIEWAEESLRM